MRIVHFFLPPAETLNGAFPVAPKVQPDMVLKPMSVKPIEQVPPYRALNPDGSARPERRKRGRIQVHWPIWFRDPTGTTEIVESVTSDLSSDGFYFLTRTPFGSGEFRMCTLGVPTNQPWSIERVLLVECKIKIIRVHSHGEGLYGVGCRIQDYWFADSNNGHTWLDVAGAVGKAAARRKDSEYFADRRKTS